MDDGEKEAADTQNNNEEQQQPKIGDRMKACRRRAPDRLRYEKLGSPSDRYHPGGWKY